MAASTGREERIRAARKMRATGPWLCVSGRVAQCRFCGNIGAAQFMRWNHTVERSECRAIAACEGRMR